MSNGYSYTKYLIHGVLSKMEEEAFEKMEQFRAWESDEDLDKYIYYKGRFEAIREALSRLLQEWG